MDNQLFHSDFELILTSLEFTKMRFDNTKYETYELRQSQLERVNTAMAEVRALRDELLDKGLE